MDAVILREKVVAKSHAEAVAVSGVVNKHKCIQALSDLRKGFEFAAGKTPIEDVRVSLGFTLYDICKALDLSEADTGKVLGAKAFSRIKGVIDD